MRARDDRAVGRRDSRENQLPPGGTGRLSSERAFSPPVGGHWSAEGSSRGYYIDFSLKADAPDWPPSWIHGVGGDFHVAVVQWALGAWERYVKGEGEAWRAGAIDAAEYLLGQQIGPGARDGAWLHWVPMPHTYRLEPPWVSAISQGEAASLLVRIHAETGDERFAEAARRALRPMCTPARSGGALAEVNGMPFFEEYPTDPPSLVLNGAIFALWGFRDVAEALGDDEARDWYGGGIDGLRSLIERYDTGNWSRYDLYPHPLPNVASPAYHLLHIRQLTAFTELTGLDELDRARGRFERYRESGTCRARALAGKVAFRLATPRNRLLAHRLPWNLRGKDADLIVLCYHAVSESWTSILAVHPSQLREQVQQLLDRGYRPQTFTDAVLGSRDEPTFAVTFDDAFTSVLETAKPVLDELGVPGTVFVPTALVGGGEDPMSWRGLQESATGPARSELRGMSWDQLATLANSGWEIGSHSRSHARLTELSPEEALRELRDSLEDCEGHLSRPCLSVAYPFGACDERTIRLAAEAGYATAAALPPPYADETVLAWPRVGVYPADTGLRYRAKISRAIRWLRRSWIGPLVALISRRVSRRGEVSS
jgi:peptidoglycan/xylan/chitin deacetylase (PgdA/CDA1 family)